MSRRAGYMFGAALRRGPRGGVGSGLGQTTSTGTVTLIPPTLEVATTGQEEVVERTGALDHIGRDVVVAQTDMIFESLDTAYRIAEQRRSASP